MRFKGLEIRPPRKTDPAETYLDFIRDLIAEGAFILVDRKPTLKEEREWLGGRLKGIRSGKQIFLTAWDGDRYVGGCEARRDLWKESGNVSMGLAVSKAYRGRGLGEKLLRETILLARRKFRPKNIYLRVFSDNKVAKSLYRKVGFRKMAHFPAWTLHKGRYVGHDRGAVLRRQGLGLRHFLGHDARVRAGARHGQASRIQHDVPPPQHQGYRKTSQSARTRAGFC